MKQKKKKEPVWRPDRISRAEENGVEQERCEAGYAVIVFGFVRISRPYPSFPGSYLLPVLFLSRFSTAQGTNKGKAEDVDSEGVKAGRSAEKKEKAG